MESITLKELSAYLQYAVTGFSRYGKKPDLLIGLLNEKDGSIIFTLLNCRTDCFKPLLRPLSDLYKEIEINGDKFVPIEKLNIPYQLMINKNNIQNMPYKTVEKFLEWHFDLFNLIERGLAIDLNSI